jgi:hypothetical protein
MEAKEVTLETAEMAESLGGQSPALTEEELRLQRKLKWKMDLIILPLLATVYFFAQMVSSACPWETSRVLTNLVGSVRSG